MPKYPSSTSTNRVNVYLRPDEQERLDAAARLLDSLGYKGLLNAKHDVNRTQAVRYLIDVVLDNPPPPKK